MSDLNRRTALTTIATLPALAVPAIAAANPDAELLELGLQFDRIELEYNSAWECENPRWEAKERAMNEWPRGLTNEQFLEMDKKLSAEIDVQLGPRHWREPDYITEDMDAPMSRIMALPASTLAGLRSRLAWRSSPVVPSTMRPMRMQTGIT